MIERIARVHGLELKTEVVYTHKHKALEIPSVLDKELAQLLGYILGDGSIEERCIRIKDERRGVLEHYAKHLEKIFKRPTTIKKQKGKNCYVLGVNGIVLVDFFRYLVKEHRELVSRSPPGVVASFIRGFADAEGSVRKKGGVITITQKNMQFLKWLQMLLLRFGITSTLRAGKTADVLGIFGTNIKTFQKEIGLTAKDKKNELAKWADYYSKRKRVIPIQREKAQELLRGLAIFPSHVLQSRKSKYLTERELRKVVSAIEGKKVLPPAAQKALASMKKLLEGDLGWQKVKKIEKHANARLLYDISVPATRNFIANGCLTHNSTYRVYLRNSQGEKRIARLVDSPCLPNGETVFKITGDGIRDV